MQEKTRELFYLVLESGSQGVVEGERMQFVDELEPRKTENDRDGGNRCKRVFVRRCGERRLRTDEAERVRGEMRGRNLKGWVWWCSGKFINLGTRREGTGMG